ncbi:MAG: Type 1 glutamine amidotransferase-like domain-containing protein [Micromonosporaceae bacterium]
MTTAAKTPTILATSGGLYPGVRTRWQPGPLLEYALELADAGPAPKLSMLGTASGDQTAAAGALHEAFYGTDVRLTCVNLLPMPNVDDLREHLLSQDVIWVGGGSVAGLLALWRLHGVDKIMRECWEAGVVLSGVSAGSICWHAGGPTDSYGPELRAVTDGLGLLPYANGVHYDAEAQRRPLLQRLVADGTLPDGYATDNGVGLLYRGTDLAEAVSEHSGAGAYRIRRRTDGAVEETRIEPRLLPGALT